MPISQPSQPLSDRWRLPVLAAALAALVGLGWYFTRLVMDLPDGIRACLAEPADHDGTRLVFPVWFVAGVEGPDRYRVSRVVKDVVVEGDSGGLERGQVITLVGTFRGQDSVVVEDHHQIHTLRTHKKALSLLALLAAVLLAPLSYAWRDGYLRIRSVLPDA